MDLNRVPDLLTQLIVWLNAASSFVGQIVFAPIAWLPGWLSATIIAVVTGCLMLLVFKYTSNQSAIRRTRNQIKANLLSLSLFKDSLAVSFRAQGRILFNAGRLFLLSLVPMLVMLLPMCLLLGQLALWYQARPLAVGEAAVITAEVAEGDIDYLATTNLVPASEYEIEAGPVRHYGQMKNTASWRIAGLQPGLHLVRITCDGDEYTKELAVGDGFMPVSQVRPTWDWLLALLNPREQPLSSTVHSIEVTYPDRAGWASGTDNWLIYWFAVSLAAAFVARPLLKVNL